MRGFRASRAMQNFKSSHFGKSNQPKQGNSVFEQNPQNQQQTAQRQELPAWLKLPEPIKAKAVEKKKTLRLVNPNAAKSTARAKAKPKSTSVAAKKRKAA